MTKPYIKETLWHFNTDGESWAITSFTDDWVDLEDTDKNGQEATHLFCEAELVDGKWKIEPSGEYSGIDFYFGEGARHAVEDYLNEHGLPE